jgi:hypothetical protein
MSARTPRLIWIALTTTSPLVLWACGGNDANRTPAVPTGGGMASDGGTSSRAGAGGTKAMTGGDGGSPNAAAGKSGMAAGGGGAGPAPVVGDCDGLGAVDEFQDITPPGSFQVLHVLVDEVNSGTIYAGTETTGVYKSTNCGADWKMISTGKNSDIVNSGLQWSMQIDPRFPNVLYSANLYASDNALFKSTNGGVDWESLMPDGSEIAMTVDYKFVQEVSIDPDKQRNEHLVVTFHAPCSGPVGPQCMAESLDGGKTWRLFKGPTDGWEENSRPIIINETTYLFVTWADGVFFTTDSGATWAKGGEGGNHQLYKAANGTYYLGSAFGMFSSSDGLHWKEIEDSPQGDGLVGDGQRIFTSMNGAEDTEQPYFVTAESDGKTWKPYASPKMPRGGVWLRYDPPHKLLYSANTESGLWRVRTK